MSASAWLLHTDSLGRLYVKKLINHRAS